MKTIAVKMPQMGESAAEGTIVKWLKNMGDMVESDEILVEVESDKINMELESPAAGRLSGCIKTGDTVGVGEVIAMIETEEEEEKEESGVHAGQDGDQVLVSTSAMPTSIEADDIPDTVGDWLSPSVMRVAMENSVSLDEIKLIDGSGSKGRVTRNDLLRYIGRRASSTGASIGTHTTVRDDDEVIPMSSIRRTIADHMVQSIQTSAHVTMVHKVDMTLAVRVRNLFKEDFQREHGVRMSFTAMITYVISRVLKEFPTINASVVGTNIVLRNDINLGCAVALPDESLVVPVVKKADRKSFTDISVELDELIGKARSRSLAHDDINGGTFTLSNFGGFGSLIGTPLISQPQVAILGMGAVFESPEVYKGEICIRNVTYLSLSFDHRVIDGAMGGRFLNAIQKKIEGLSSKSLELASAE
jgi:2-oxoglutarate dehydrogenase E2 component (dihydrolipoamide succinyltransferase)